MSYTLEQGKKLIKLAKDAVYSNITSTDEFKEKRGVFVTLHTYPEKALRGCIGFPEPVLPLGQAVIESAKEAAYHDNRFSPLNKKEKVIFEVSILTTPKIIKVKDSKEYLKKIKIGRDGLIAEIKPFRGLLLPQVPLEHNMDVEEFLNQTCLKAGLLEDSWKSKECKISSFQSQIFYEQEPNGKIIEKQ